MDELIHGCDSLEKIQMCLNCTQKECTNCLNYGRPRQKTRFSEEVRAELIECIRQGVKQRVIAKKLDVSDPTISRWVSYLRKEGAL